MALKNNVKKNILTWHYNLLGQFFVLLLIFVMFSLTVIIKDSLVEKEFEKIELRWFEYSKKFDLTLDDIVIEGRGYVLQKEVFDLLNLDRQSSFLAIDEDEVKKKIKQLPWIKDVFVKKNYVPNVLQIKLIEKKVIALYLKDAKFLPLDESGKIIDVDFVAVKEHLIVSGSKAPEHIAEILKVVSSNEAVFKRIKALQFVSERRWNVVLDDIKKGKVIKLPEENYEQAWKKMLKLNISHGLLKRPLTIIDLRFDNKTIFELDKKSLRKNVKEIKA